MKQETTARTGVTNANANQTYHHRAEELSVGRYLLMDRTVDLLLQKAKSSEHWPELYRRADAVLETLPLAAGEYSLARRRLANAHRYAARQEYGAAAFELRVLRGKLAS